jgi:hypothetical protein
MNGYLLDTNVVSEYSRARPPDAQVRKWVDAQREDSLHLSVLTLGEIRKERPCFLPAISDNAWRCGSKPTFPDGSRAVCRRSMGQ